LVGAKQGFEVLHKSVFAELDAKISDCLKDGHSDAPVLVLCGVLQEHNKSWAKDLLTDYYGKFAEVLGNVETHL
jgi:hypothetical protein